MVRQVSAAQANREISKLLRAAQNGERTVVTSRGKPMAEIVPPSSADDTLVDRRAEERVAFLQGLARQPARNFPRLTRDDFYD